MEASVGMFPAEANVVAGTVDAGGVPADWVTVEGQAADRVVLYLHGGGYVMASRNTLRGLAGRIARAAGARILLPDYRLAPESPFPAAIEDAMTCWRWLVAAGIPPAQMAIGQRRKLMTTDEAVALFAPLKKTMHLKVSVAQAFARFAEHFGDWWPRQSGHCVFGNASTGCSLEPGVGGRILESGEDDQTAEWGRVVLWEPPHRLSFDWYPGRTAESAQRIEVSFTADNDGTRIDLTHHDWHLLGDRAGELRQSYDGGWDQVLGTFGAHAARASARSRYESEPRGRIAAFQTTIQAPVKEVWRLLATEEGINQWFTEGATLEGRAGGALVFRWRELANDGGTMELYGRVVRYDPGACFSFDWQADSGTYDLRCQIEFEAAGDSTVVRLTEEGFQDTHLGLQDLLNRQSGWSQQLTRLKVFAEHGIRV